MNERLDQLRQQLREDPSSRLFFQLGELLRKEGELDEAESVLKSGLENHPRYVAAWISLGRVEFATTRWAAAEKSYASALELDPENAVAARLIGETAEEQRQWERAHKAYQLAHMLSGRDPELALKISEMERRIAGDESYDAPTEPDVSIPQAYEPPVTASPEFDVLEETEEVFDDFPGEPELETEIETEPDLDPEPSPPQRSREVVTFSDEDPFASRATGDTGVIFVGDDVFEAPQPAPADEPEVVFGAEDAPDDQEEVAHESEPETWAGVEDGDEGLGVVEEVLEPALAEEPPDLLEEEADFEPEVISVVEVEGDEEALTDVQAPPGSVDDSFQAAADDVPLPTLTLARLAVDQDDVDLARRTLRSLLARNPADHEAAMMLEELDGLVAVPIGEGLREESTTTDLPAAKATALRGWMEAIRLAAERRAL